MSRRFWPIVNTLLFTIFVPGTVAILIPRWLLGGFTRPPGSALTWIGGVVFLIGAAICARVGYSRPDCAHEISGDDRTPSLRPQPDVHRCGDGYSWRSRRIPIHSRRRVRGRDAADRSHLRCPLRGTNLAAPIRRVLRGIQRNCAALVAANWRAAVGATAAKT
jgi:hypothetical protein